MLDFASKPPNTEEVCSYEYGIPYMIRGTNNAANQYSIFFNLSIMLRQRLPVDLYKTNKFTVELVFN